MSEEIWDHHVTRAGQVTTVALSGEIDMSVGGDVFRVMAEELRRSGTETVRIDLSAVSFLGSAGLQALVKARKLADAQCQRLVVTGAKGLPRQVLETTGLLTLLGETEPGLRANN